MAAPAHVLLAPMHHPWRSELHSTPLHAAYLRPHPTPPCTPAPHTPLPAQDPELLSFIDIECYCWSTVLADLTPMINAGMVFCDRHYGGINYPKVGAVLRAVHAGCAGCSRFFFLWRAHAGRGRRMPGVAGAALWRTTGIHGHGRLGRRACPSLLQSLL